MDENCKDMSNRTELDKQSFKGDEKEQHHGDNPQVGLFKVDRVEVNKKKKTVKYVWKV